MVPFIYAALSRWLGVDLIVLTWVLRGREERDSPVRRRFGYLRIHHPDCLLDWSLAAVLALFPIPGNDLVSPDIEFW